MCVTALAVSSPAVQGFSHSVTTGRSLGHHGRGLRRRSRGRFVRHERMRVNSRGETRENERVEKEDGAKNSGRLDKDVTRVSTKRRLESSTTKRATKATFFRLLKHDDEREHDADRNFNYVQKTNENRHLFLTFLIFVYYTKKPRENQM